MTMNCLATPTQRRGEPEAPARASVPERFNCGKGQAYSEPARLRDQFTGRKRPKDSDRPQPENQNKTQNIGMKTPKITAISRYHKQSVLLHRDARKERAEPFALCRGQRPHAGRCQRGRSGSLLLEAGALHLTAAVADAPANWACDAHHHE